MTWDFSNTRIGPMAPGYGRTFAGQLSRRAGLAVWLAGSATGWLVTLAIVYGLVETLG